MKDTPVKKDKMVARKVKEHKIPIMKVGKSKKKPSATKRKRGRPRGEEKAPKKKEAGRKRKSKDSAPPPLKKRKTMNGDSVHKPFLQKGESHFNCTPNSNGTLHPPKKTLMFNPKKNSISILKKATFHPPISLTKKESPLNGSSNLSSFKLLPAKNKSSLKKKVSINSLCKELETSSKTGKVNNLSPLSQLTVSNELGRNLAKDIVQFCSKEPSKSKDATKPPSKETVKYQSKESPKSILKESSKIHPNSETQIKDSGKTQTKDSGSKSSQKERAKPLLKDTTKLKDAIKPTTKSQPKETAVKPHAKSQQKELVKLAPVKSHPQRMASLDAMAKMHVICTTDRRPPEPRHNNTSVAVTHQKSFTQCHERIQFDLKKETNDIKGKIVHKQEINYVKEKQQVFVSHSVVEREQSKTEKSKKPVKAKLKPIPSNHSRPPTEKGGGKKPKEGGDRKKDASKKKKTQSEVKVKETIRMQKTCTYQSVTTVNSSSAASTTVVPAKECSENKANSYCCARPQIIPLAHVASDASTSRCDSAFSIHRFGHHLFAPPTSTECGCCSLLLRKSLVAHLPPHHFCCCLCLPHRPSSLVPYEPLDLSPASREQLLLNGCCPKPALLVSTSKSSAFAHGWSWKGKPREKLVALTNDSIPCSRICYPGVEHQEGDTISERDCVLLRSGPKDTDLPYVAKVAAFWENPDDGEMMMSLLWYYRPEHTDQGRKTGQMEDEVFASRHKDVNSVACIEDKCYVLTYNEYCRYKASLSMDDAAMVSVSSLVVPELADGYPRKNRLPCEPVSQDIVFFCRHVYDFRQKRILKNPT